MRFHTLQVTISATPDAVRLRGLSQGRGIKVEFSAAGFVSSMVYLYVLAVTPASDPSKITGPWDSVHRYCEGNSPLNTKSIWALSAQFNEFTRRARDHPVTE